MWNSPDFPDSMLDTHGGGAASPLADDREYCRCGVLLTHRNTRGDYHTNDAMMAEPICDTCGQEMEDEDE